MLTTLCARLGIGGFYHYLRSAHGTQILGPYRRRRAAQGPTWHARVYGVTQAVEYHLWRPAGAITPLGVCEEEP